MSSIRMSLPIRKTTITIGLINKNFIKTTKLYSTTLIKCVPSIVENSNLLINKNNNTNCVCVDEINEINSAQINTKHIKSSNVNYINNWTNGFGLTKRFYHSVASGNCNVTATSVSTRTPKTVDIKHSTESARNYSDKKSKKMSKSGLVSLNDAKQFIIDCFLASKTSKEHAIAMADLLVEADYRGHFSHGMNRLEMYINDLHKNSTDGFVEPTILNETPASAWVDGNNGLGVVVGNFCMDLAIKKAKTVGVGWVCAKRSNHYGIAGWYSITAMKQGLIGMSMTNTSPLMSPTRSTGAALGTNPITLAAPANNGDSFVLDMATTAVAVGKIEIKRRKNEPIPEGWAQDPEGKSTTDAELGFTTGCLMPLGGSELTSGYKGYGLGAMVEILCGVSSGAKFSTQIRKWTHTGADSEADLGQCFIAVDPKCFAPGFTDRMSEMNNILRDMPATDPKLPVLVAGDPEREHMKTIDLDGGLPYIENQIKTCHALSERLNIPKIKFLA